MFCMCVPQFGGRRLSYQTRLLNISAPLLTARILFFPWKRSGDTVRAAFWLFKREISNFLYGTRGGAWSSLCFAHRSRHVLSFGPSIRTYGVDPRTLMLADTPSYLASAVISRCIWFVSHEVDFRTLRSYAFRAVYWSFLMIWDHFKIPVITES